MQVNPSRKPTPVSTASALSTPLATRSTTSPARLLRVGLCILGLLLALGTTAVRAQDSHHALDYKSIVVFGDSLSDTGNVAHLTQAKYGVQIPGPAADYTAGRFTDGEGNTEGRWLELSELLE